MKKLLKEINKPPRMRLARNEIVTENIGAMVGRLKLNTVTMAQLAHFLFLSSLEDAGPLRLLERFKRVIRNGQPDTYELQFWLDRKKDSFRTVDDILERLH